MAFYIDPKELKHQFIARPDSSKDLVVYKWPNNNIPYLSVVTVQPDEWAFFIKKGEIAGYLEPGETRLDGASIPFLNKLLDKYTGNNVLLSELYFVSSREFTSQRFGGSMGDMRDPVTQVVVRCGVFGEYAFKVADPGKMLLNLVGTRGVDTNDEIADAIRDPLVKMTRSVVNKHLIDDGWDLIKITSGAYNPDLEQEILDKVGRYLDEFGVMVTRIEDFVVNILAEDKPKLQEIYDRRAKMDLAGDARYAEMAQNEAVLGAAEGMAKGGAGMGSELGTAGVGMAIGMKMAENMVSGGQGASGASFERCPGCGKPMPAGSKFCPDCGHATRTTCPHCGKAVPGGKFCNECGQPLG